jgi:Fe-S-cluster containining protein
MDRTKSPADLKLDRIRLGNKRPPLAVPESARAVQRQIVSHIKNLLDSDVRSPLDPFFMNEYRAVLDLFEKYQHMVIEHSGHHVTCARGCTRCCFHWVEDVYSFEAEIVADYIRTNRAEQIDEIIEKFSRDIEEVERLDLIVAEKLKKYSHEEGCERIDPVDLLLASFYQLRRPCALLTDSGECGIYPVRPLTCRVYVSFSDPVYCDPDYINVSDVRTYLLDLQETASRLLDQLHMEFDRFDGDTGLRSVLVKCLTGPR